METTVRHFSRGIWVNDNSLHGPGFELELSNINDIHSDIRVDLAVIALTVFIAVSITFAYLYFTYNNLWLIGLALLIASFAWLRHIMFNYVELYVTVNGRNRRIMVVGMEQRDAAYEVEDYLKKLISA